CARTGGNYNYYAMDYW
nr:immunoglobulin heavy chain junction region [Mus musculus]